MNCYHLPILRFLLPFLVGIIIQYQFQAANFTSITALMMFLGVIILLLLIALIYSRKHLYTAVIFFASISLSLLAVGLQKKSTQINVPVGPHSGTIIIEKINKQNDQLCSFTFWNQNNQYLCYALIPHQQFLPSDTLSVQNMLFNSLDLTDSTFKKYNQYLYQKGIRGTVFLKESNLLRCRHGNSLYSRIYQLRRYLSAKIRNADIFEPKEESIFLSLLLGEKSYLDRELKKHYQQAGIIHVLAISGLHVGILYLFLQFALRALPFRSPLLVFIVITTVLVFYAMLSGLSPSVLRACVMCCILEFSLLIQSKHHPINTVLSSALLLLIFHPAYLFDLGFQLSYVAVFFILYGLNCFQSVDKQITVVPKWLKKIQIAFRVNCLAFFGTAPLLLFHFKLLYGISLFSGLVLIPLISTVVVSGFISLLLCEIPFLFRTSLHFCNYTLMCCNRIIDWIALKMAGEINYGIDLPTLFVLFTIFIIILTPFKSIIQKWWVLSSCLLLLFICSFLP